jgi:DNA polymerase-3 subunit gamma/tau
MSYQVIARKWRPQTFEDVTGQEAITRTLRNAVEHDRLHHAYLFSGARGVGKTTTARLLAKALNCHKTDKPNPIPCSPSDADVCASCIEIAESRSIDVLEFDAASHTGVDDIREIIIESININPARDRYKVFIIDEVHMLSNSSFNALLKTLEEPPPNVAFIMATTELHKVPDTILSRCQEFDFRTIPLGKILERLKLIAKAENIDVTDEALREIARSGEGSMRDAQSNFDQVISFSGEKIGVEDVMLALGIAGAEILTRTVKAIAVNMPAEILKVVDDLMSRGQDLRNFCRDLLSFFRDLLIFKMAGDVENLLDTAILSQNELEENAAPFSEADLIRFFNSLSETESKLREASQPRYVLEIGLVKLVEMRRVAPVEKILERLAELEKSLAAGTFEPKTETLESPFETQIPPSEPEAVARVSASAEKKTLTPEISREDVPVQHIEPKHSVQTQPEKEIEPEKPAQTASANSSLRDLIASMPVKLPPISAEELEHVDDAKLDDAFEQKLLEMGDDLYPIKDASKLVGLALKTNQISAANAKSESANGAAAAVAPAKDKPEFSPPNFDVEEGELPELSDNPTEEEMLNYANNHPLVRQFRRVFRGAEIVEVKKRNNSEDF